MDKGLSIIILLILTALLLLAIRRGMIGDPTLARLSNAATILGFLLAVFVLIRQENSAVNQSPDPTWTPVQSTDFASTTETTTPSVTFSPVSTNIDLPTATPTLEPTITPSPIPPTFTLIPPTSTRSFELVDRGSIYPEGNNGSYEIPPIYSEPLRVIAFGYSWPDFRKLTYTISGDFEVVVRTKTKSPQQIGNAARSAGLGVVSSETKRIVLFLKRIVPIPTGEDVRVVGGTLDKMDDYGLGETTECIADEMTLKIVKRGSFFSFLCRKDSQDWTVVRADFQIDMGDIVRVFLFAYSTDQEQIEAEFYDFAVLPY